MSSFRTVFFFIALFLSSIGFNSLSAQQMPEPPEGFYAGQAVGYNPPQTPGLLFYLSAEKGFEADWSTGGQYLPNYLSHVSILEDGVRGKGIRAADNQLLSYWAPGNIYAQRGTVSFFWRSRYPVGPTPFPVFRVGYADHKSWDMVWLRIDYNGSGFDAFVTDVGLSRTRVSFYMDEFPEPDEWIHLALAWDETRGIRLYVNGEPAASQSNSGSIYDTGLDQFGPHSRIISPYQVQSRYNFERGGDLDELKIFDRMLGDEDIKTLFSHQNPVLPSAYRRSFSERRWRDAWWKRHGWNLPNEAPPVLENRYISVRKVEVQEAIDVRRRNLSALDGIRETTWPGVYNMSRLPGRYDYFVLPDWDAYSASGQTIRFQIPDEPWNHVEIFGTAWGQLTLENEHPYQHTFGVRTRNQVKSWHRLSETQTGGVIRFDNALIEEPIGSFMVYHVDTLRAPEGNVSRNYTLRYAPEETESRLDRAIAYIRGRFPADEQATMLAVPTTNRRFRSTPTIDPAGQPIVHVLIPYEDIRNVGLDGIQIDLPALGVRPTHDGKVPLNIRVMDPLWELRDWFDFSFSVEVDKSHSLWLDLRDRVLPEGRSLHIIISSSGQDFNATKLEGTGIRLVYKHLRDARDEHIEDRLRQVKTLHAHNVEESPRTSRLNSYNRVMADIEDILKIDPVHWLARAYKTWTTRDESVAPEYEIAPTPAGIPQWAHLQIEYLKHIERVIMFYVDERQISNGEFGGGLSDDGDFTNMLPGTAFLGIQPEKVMASLALHMTSYFDQDRAGYDAPLKQPSLPLFTNGLATIQTDELHAYEDGIQVVAQMQLVEHGIPVHFNRGLETARRVLEDITAVSPDGKRRFRSRYYGGTAIAYEDPWQWSVPNSYIMLHNAYNIVRHNGSPVLRQQILDMADMLLSYMDENGQLFSEIHWETGESRGDPGMSHLWNLLMAAYEFSGDYKYKAPIEDRFRLSVPFNPEAISARYTEQITRMGIREYISTIGNVWIDRVERVHPVIQEDRLGGVSLIRIQNIFPTHRVSWNFKSPSTYQSAAIYFTESSREKLHIVAFNMEERPVQTDMTLWEINPGMWRVRQGRDTNGDQRMDAGVSEKVVYLERGSDLAIHFDRKGYHLLELELVEPARIGYWGRPDLGVGPDDVTITSESVFVRVHNLGSVKSPESVVVLRNANGREIARVTVPEIEAPIDLVPKWVDLRIAVPQGSDVTSGSIEIDPEHKVFQITRRNTIVSWVPGPILGTSVKSTCAGIRCTINPKAHTMIDSKLLTLLDAERIAAAAIDKAIEDNLTVAVAIVDAGGHLMYFKKIDQTQLASVEIAIEKARTSVMFKRPTKNFQEGIAGGNNAMLRLPDMLPFEGGLPIIVDGHVIGAIGVSGATPAQDGTVAKAGLDAL